MPASWGEREDDLHRQEFGTWSWYERRRWQEPSMSWERRRWEGRQEQEEEAPYDLTDPAGLAAYLFDSDTKLIRAEYLRALLDGNGRLRRRQELENATFTDSAGVERTVLVSHEEVQAWAAGSKEAIICTVSHPWEAREHPDPYGHQLRQLVHHTALYSAAFLAEIWVFFDFMCICQYPRVGESQVRNDRRARENGHCLYAHECSITFRIETLTPEDRREEAIGAGEMVTVYDEATDVLKPYLVQDLMENRTPFTERGWCICEVEMSSDRASTAQNQAIDIAPPSMTTQGPHRPALRGRVPTLPKYFPGKVEESKFTHRVDTAAVIKLQESVFLETVRRHEVLSLQGLSGSEIRSLAHVLPEFKKLQIIKLVEFDCGKEEVEVFAKALRETKVMKFECRTSVGYKKGLNHMIQALCAVLNKTSIVDLDLARKTSNDATMSLATLKAVTEMLKVNEKIHRLDLSGITFSDEGMKALRIALGVNGSLTDLHFEPVDVPSELNEALARALATIARRKRESKPDKADELFDREANMRLRRPFDAPARFENLAADLKKNQPIHKIDLSSNQMKDSGAEVLAQMLRVNEMIMEVKLNFCGIGPKGVQALAEALKINKTVQELALRGNNFGNEGAEALANTLKVNEVIIRLHLSKTEIGDKGVQALAGALETNTTVREVDLCRCNIGVSGAQALAQAIQSRSFIDLLNLDDCFIGDAVGDVLHTILSTCTVLTLSFRRTGLGDAGAQALANGLHMSGNASGVQKLHLDGNEVGVQGGQALANALYTQSTLTWVSLQENFLGAEVVEALGAGLATNQTIEKLLVGGNKIPAADLEALRQRFDARLVLEVDPSAGLSEDEQRFHEELLSWQKKGTAPLPTIRLSLVGRGRAGKTTTFRRLKGEEVTEGEETSTYGIEVWAGEMQEEMDQAFKLCENRLLDECAAKSFKPKLKSENWKSKEEDEDEDDEEEVESGEVNSIEEEAIPSRSEMKKHEMREVKKEEGIKEEGTKEKGVGKTIAGSDKQGASAGGKRTKGEGEKEGFEDALGARRMDTDLIIKPPKSGISPRLQCFDFPGQKEYALLNMIYFHGRGIYLIFCDMSVELEEAWKDLKFWLWAVGRYANDGHQQVGRTNSSSPVEAKRPPILLVGTKKGKKRFQEKDIGHRIDNFLEQMPQLRCQLQVIDNEWLFPIDNFVGWENDICRLREKLGNLALDILTTEESWKSLHPEEEIPQHVALQSKPCLVPWIQAYEVLTQLGEGVELRVDKRAVQLKEGPGGRAELLNDLVGRHLQLQHSVIAPRGCIIRPKSQGHRNKGAQDTDVEVIKKDLSEDESPFVTVLISCDFLELQQVEKLLFKMEPQGIPAEDVMKVLQLMNDLGAVFWLDEAHLRETVALNVRKLSVALSSLMSLRFWDESNFQHEKAFRQKLDRQTQNVQDDVLRFQTSGIATKKLLDCLWRDDFSQSQQEVVLEVLLRKGLMAKCAVAGEYAIPCCLPLSYLPEPPLIPDDKSSAILYIELDGFVSSNFLPSIVDHLRKSQVLSLISPPQFFRNLIQLRSDEALITMSVTSVTKQRLLRIQVSTQDETASSIATKMAEAFWDALGLDGKRCSQSTELARVQFPSIQDLDLALKQFADTFIKQNPCLRLGCDCSACKPLKKLGNLLEERFYCDLSPHLLEITKSCSLQNFSRPAGSFRFKRVQFPGDVDIEEYIILPTSEDPTVLDAQEREAKAREQALQALSADVQKLCQTMKLHESRLHLYWGGLKAGRDKAGKTLTWTKDEILADQKNVTWQPCEGEVKSVMTLSEALALGHNTWTAKIDCFAKTTLFPTSQESARHFYEVTNVIRFGFGTHAFTPVTKEKDFLRAVNSNIHDYSCVHPKAMKYVKRLWERSAFFSQRNIDIDKHLAMLGALEPILRHWVAEVNQIAAHAETLINMLQHQHMEKDALEDLTTLCRSLEVLQEKLDRELSDPEKVEGSKSIGFALKCLQCSKGASAKGASYILHVVQDLLECCVEVVVITKLSSFPSPVSLALQEKWTFPSDHPPIGARVSKCCGLEVEINLVSWNVLNHNYMEDIKNDSHGLSRSKMAEMNMAERQEAIFIKVDMMLKHKHVLCLQECWPELVEYLQKVLDGKFAMLTTEEHEKKNAEAIIYDTTELELKDVYKAKYESDSKAILEALLQLRGKSTQVRVVTTQLPGDPYGLARRQFCDFVVRRKEIYRETPTLLLADMSFPDEAIRPLLKHFGQLDHVHFLHVPYPTNICKGSLLPKRIDCIASFSSPDMIEVKPLEAEDVLCGLSEVVQLLKSRSLELAIA